MDNLSQEISDLKAIVRLQTHAISVLSIVIVAICIFLMLNI